MANLPVLPAYYLLLDVAPVVVGVALTWTGVRCLQDAQALAKFFGVPDANKDEVVFFQSSTGRNISAALFIWILTYMGERKVLGIFLLCWVSAGIHDTKLLYEHPRGNHIGMRVRNIFTLMVLGTLLVLAPSR